ncbi:MAG: hypothetical protein IPO78_14715 [Saprospiraceae bacterium]|nr:hypothetical protein [Saprospiraceae bacterium]
MFQEKNQSFNKFTEIFSFTPGIQEFRSIYAICPQNNKKELSNPVPIIVKIPIVNLETPTISGQNISLIGRFNIIPYLSMEYGFCYSFKSNPKISDNKIKVASTGITSQFTHTFTPPSNGKYYLTSYVIDCDDTIYSDTKQIDFNPPPVCNTSSNFEATYKGDATRSVSSFLLDGQLYMGGGINSNLIFVPSFYKYDETTKSWSGRDPIPITSSATNGIAAFFSYNKKAYILEKNKATFYEYNPTVNNWGSVRPFAGSPRQEAIGINNSTRSFIIGGKYSGNGLKDMWEFIISGNTYSWVQKNYNSLMGNRIGAGGFIINEVIYIFGGENTDDKLWRYDLQNNLWIDVVQFPIPTGLSGFYKGISFSYNNEGFAIKDNSNEIYKFNPNTGWCLAGSYTPFRQNGTAVSNNNKLFFGLGSNGSANNYKDINTIK